MHYQVAAVTVTVAASWSPLRSLPSCLYVGSILLALRTPFYNNTEGTATGCLWNVIGLDHSAQATLPHDVFTHEATR